MDGKGQMTVIYKLVRICSSVVVLEVALVSKVAGCTIEGERLFLGKKFAYLEMRTVLMIIFWNFRLLPVVPDLTSYRSFDWRST
jgi:hypothetical protein